MTEIMHIFDKDFIEITHFNGWGTKFIKCFM